MPLTNKITNTFRCDFKDSNGKQCDVEFDFNPGAPGQPPPQWGPAIQARLTKVVQVVHAMTGYTTWYCSDEHAVESIGYGHHLPPLPPKIVPATSDAEVRAAANGAKTVAQMKSH